MQQASSVHLPAPVPEPAPLQQPPGPAGATWRLRISLADIDADGPFSAFAGVQRWFTVVQGAGVRLRWPGRSLDLDSASAPLHFDGADAPDCALLDGSTRDLNLMLRGLSGGLVRAQADEPWSPPAGAWCACFSTGAGLVERVQTAQADRDQQADHLTTPLPAMGLLVLQPPSGAIDVSGANGALASAAPWCFVPQAPAAQAWWLWADLTSTPATRP